MVFDLSVLHPRREPTKLAIVAIVCHPHLRTNEEDLRVVDNDSAVIYDVFVHDRPVEVSAMACKNGTRMTRIPISQTISLASSDFNISERTSQA